MHWQEDKIGMLMSIENEHQLFALIASIALEMGFDYCAYGLKTLLPITQPRIAMLNNYPTSWQEQYENKHYVSTDPTVQHAIHSTDPIIWSDKLFKSARDLWQDARSVGLTYGWAQSSFGIHGVVGLLTLARGSEKISDEELRANESKMSWLTQVSHSLISERLVPKLLPESSSKLSMREIEILRWTGDGKTAWEISSILKISERTVNFHINNTLIKLDSANKTAAVVKATILGMLK